MPTPKKAATKAPKVAAPSKSAQKTVVKSNAATKAATEKSSEQLVVDNFAAVSTVVGTLGATLDMLVQKVESMAYHIVATEAILAELVAENGLSLARVNTRIRIKIAAGTDNNGNADKAIDVAASIASPLPRR